MTRPSPKIPRMGLTLAQFMLFPCRLRQYNHRRRCHPIPRAKTHITRVLPDSEVVLHLLISIRQHTDRTRPKWMPVECRLHPVIPGSRMKAHAQRALGLKMTVEKGADARIPTAVAFSKI